MDPKKIQLKLKADDETLRGTHGTDVMVSTSEKDVSLTFLVPSITPGEALVTTRIFIPHSTALQMAAIKRTTETSRRPATEAEGVDTAFRRLSGRERRREIILN